MEDPNAYVIVGVASQIVVFAGLLLGFLQARTTRHDVNHLTHEVNSKMDRALEVRDKASRAEGRLEMTG